MRVAKQEFPEGTNHEIPRRTSVLQLPNTPGTRGREQVQVLGFTDPVDAEAALQRGETLTAFWDGKQVVWR